MSALVAAALASAALGEGKSRAERERIAGEVMAVLLASERCNPAAGRHVTPHVGCVLR